MDEKMDGRVGGWVDDRWKGKRKLLAAKPVTRAGESKGLWS